MLFGAFPSVGLVVAPGDVLLEPDPLDTALPRDPRFAARTGHHPRGREDLRLAGGELLRDLRKRQEALRGRLIGHDRN